MASTLPEATSSQHSSRAGRSAELAASEPQPAAPPLPLACELTGGGGDRVPETERVNTGALNFLRRSPRWLLPTQAATLGLLSES